MFWSISASIFSDPRLSRIEKMLLKFSPKFLDLYCTRLYTATQIIFV